MLTVNITVHHGDASNDGENLAEAVLTPSNVNATDFGKLFSTQLDGAVFAQPLYVQNVNITRGSSQGVHSVLYVATMHDSLYAIDANLGTVRWKDNFLNISDPTNLKAQPRTACRGRVILRWQMNTALIAPATGARHGRPWRTLATRQRATMTGASNRRRSICIESREFRGSAQRRRRSRKQLIVRALSCKRRACSPAKRNLIAG